MLFAGVSVAAGQLARGLSSTAVVIVVARELGSEAAGTLAAVFAVGTVGGLVAAWGAPAVLYPLGGRRRQLREATASHLGLSLIASVPTSLCAVLVTVAFVPDPSSTMIWFVSVQVFTQAVTAVVVAAAVAAGRTRDRVIVDIMSGVATLSSLVALLGASTSLDGALQTWSVASLLASGLSVAVFGTVPSRPSPTRQEVIVGASAMTSSVAFAMNNTSDRVVLVNHDAAAAGEYAIAYRLITIGVMLVAGSNSVMVPRLYREPAGRPAVRSAVALNAKAALVGIVATALCLLVAHGILPDAEFTSLPLAVLLLSSVIFARATSMPLLDALTASGEQHVRTRILVGAAVANLAANLALVSTFGLWAAVGSTLASEGLVVWLSARRVARTPTHERSE